RVSSAALARADSVGIVRGAKGDADRHARHVEGLTQAVDEVAHIRARHGFGPRARKHEAWRARLDLRDVFDLEAAAGDSRWRMARHHLLEPTVERSGG